jgi:hypothetical protein
MVLKIMLLLVPSWRKNVECNMFLVYVTEYYTPAGGGRPYASEQVVATMLTELEAKLQAAEYNTRAVSGQYYSIRKVEE